MSRHGKHDRKGKKPPLDVICATCKGKGVVDVERRSNEAEKHEGGRGEYTLQTCNTCGGKGRIPFSK